MNDVLRSLIASSENIVFFGGAGVSTESGIPDFRSQDGLYNQKYRYPTETIISRDFFLSNPKEFYAFYREKMLYLDAKPNKAHASLAALEQAGKLTAVITQNIDGLHQAAGSNTVLELHGSVLRNCCMRCGKPFSVRDVYEASGVPHCSCGGIIKPDVTLYGETLPEGILERAAEYISKADMLIVGGTSLAVYPAAGLAQYYRGNKLVLINKTPTPLDSSAHYVFHGAIGEVLAE